MENTVPAAVPGKDGFALALVDLLASPYDELVEVDTNRGTMRTLRHAEQFYAPIFDTEMKDMLRFSAENMIHPEDQERYIEFNNPLNMAQRMRSAETPGILRARFRYKLIDGGWTWVEQVDVGCAEQGLPEGVFYAFLYDLEHPRTEQGAKRRDALSRNALTGLLWEEVFFQRAKPLVQEHVDDWCLIAFDLEHFKLFNEWYGRRQGDMLLAQIGAKLSKLEEQNGALACYVGQDDFCLLAPYRMDEIEQLFDDVHELVRKHGTSVGFMPAFGVAPLANNRECGIEELYDRASLAARRAKENYHSRIRVFDPSMYEQTEKDYQILSEFQDALSNHELFFMLQPQCRISTGRVVGAESLVRWRKANGEMVSPGVFVPVLEEYGFVTEMDKYVWEEVCAWQRTWIDSGRTPLPISVNVSQTDISAIDVPEFFESLIQKYDLSPDVIKIEITESAYVDNSKVADTVQRLREKGFLVLMDDFGSGYSSLNMLRNLNVDIIKLDAQFLRMSGDDRRKGLQIMEAIVSMARTMSVPVIVEGVETKEESDFLSGLGCRYVQGYFFYRPMKVNDFADLISDPQQIDTRGFRFKAKEQFHTREFLDQNVFNDTVLNNILGPVAFYVWHGESVDIVRLNQQYYNEISGADFRKRMKNIQNVLLPEDVPVLYDMLSRAMADPINGAGGVLRFDRSDGAVAQFRMHFYFVEQDESGRRFYGSVHDLTEFITLNDHMRLLSRVSVDSTVFVRRRKEKWDYHVVIHGLAEETGLDREQLEQALNDGSFLRSVPPDDRAKLEKLREEGGKSGESLTRVIRFLPPGKEALRLRLQYSFVHDAKSGVVYIITIRKDS